MLPVILPMIPMHEVYTEAFCGGAAVLFAKRKVKNETINDRLDIVVNFYQQIKSNFDGVNALIQQTCYARSEHDKALLIIRNHTLFGAVEKAWAFWFLSNFSYGNEIGGGIKYSNDQSVLLPHVLNTSKQLFTKKIIDRIEGLHIENRDAVQVLDSRDVKKAFHYIDPPYSHADNGHYKGYTFDDLRLLLEWCEQCKGRFLLSNYRSELLTEFIERNGWQTSVNIYRNKGMRRNDINRYEILVWNYDLPQKQLF